MRTEIEYGRSRAVLDVTDANLITARRATAAAGGPAGSPAVLLRAALESPHDFPPLRRALTPGDRVTLVVDPGLPDLAAHVRLVLEYLGDAGVPPDQVTMVQPPSGPGSDDWVEDLPDELGDARLEVHNPADRRRLSYLATTSTGRRVYLNRSVVDADQAVVLTRHRYDPLLGRGGGVGALFPGLSDEATVYEMFGRLTLGRPTGSREKAARPADGEPSLAAEAAEITWLLGVPFMLGVIAGPGGRVAAVVGGATAAVAEADRQLDACWRSTVDRHPRTVVAAVGQPGADGRPTGPDFETLARAAGCAARVVEPEGRIVLLTDTTPRLGPASELVRQAQSPAGLLKRLRQAGPESQPGTTLAAAGAAFLWASAAERATIYLLSGLSEELTEELFAVPLGRADQAQRLLDSGGPCLFVPDAENALVIEDG